MAYNCYNILYLLNINMNKAKHLCRQAASLLTALSQLIDSSYIFIYYPNMIFIYSKNMPILFAVDTVAFATRKSTTNIFKTTIKIFLFQTKNQLF